MCINTNIYMVNIIGREQNTTVVHYRIGNNVITNNLYDCPVNNNNVVVTDIGIQKVSSVVEIYSPLVHNNCVFENSAEVGNSIC